MTQRWPWLIRVQQLLLVALVILLPSNLFKKFGVSSGYVHGLFVDYLLPKFYLSDIFVLGLLATWGVEIVTGTFSWPSKKIRTWLNQHRVIVIVWSLLSLLLIVRQFFSAVPLSSLWYLSKIFECILLAAFLVSHSHLLNHRQWWRIVGAALCLHSSLAIFQFVTQTNLFPSYLWFGEPRLAQPVGLAHLSWGGVEHVLPYGISAHPNILAGYLSLGLISFWWLSQAFFSRSWAKIFTAVVTVFTILALLFTTSISAWGVVVIGCGIFLFGSQLKLHVSRLAFLGGLIGIIVIPLSLHFATQDHPDVLSITRRAGLNQAALEVWQHSPVWGTGLNAFTTQLENVHPSQEFVRFVQPVHHVGFLWLAETGLIGVIWAFLSCVLVLLTQPQSISFRSRLVAVAWLLLPLTSLDHYLFTNQTGLLLLCFITLFVPYALTATRARRELL